LFSQNRDPAKITVCRYGFGELFFNKEYLIFSRLQVFLIFDWVFIKKSQDSGTKKPANFVVSLCQDYSFSYEWFCSRKVCYLMLMGPCIVIIF